MTCKTCSGLGYVEHWVHRDASLHPKIGVCPTCEDVEAYSDEIKRRMNPEPQSAFFNGMAGPREPVFFFVSPEGCKSLDDFLSGNFKKYVPSEETWCDDSENVLPFRKP